MDARTLTAAFAKQILKGLDAGSVIPAASRFNAKRTPIVVAGMGGSALPGLLLEQQTANGEWRIANGIRVHRDYALPYPLSPIPHPFIVCISYSGNTEETLSAYSEARRRRLPVAAIASGGTLAEWAARDKIPFARIPDDVPPRYGLRGQIRPRS